MNIFERLFGAPSAPPQTIGEMVGGAAADPSQLMDQLANRERTQQVTNYMLYDSPFAEIVQAPLRGLRTFDDVAMGRMPTHVANEVGEMVPNPQMVSGMADLAGSVTVGAGVMPDASDLRMGIKAYHGSPHDFDKFEWSPRTQSTGDGTQVYGSGLYFAESEDVANAYKNILAPGTGKVYEVDINTSPDRMLDWDQPLSADLPQEIKDAFNSIANSSPEIKEKFYSLYKNKAPGRDYYSTISDMAKTGNFDSNQAHATKVFKDAGIPGIKYLDANSRAKDAGTRNYVVFDDSMVEILRKYGIGGLLAGGAGGLAVGSQLSPEDRNRS